MNAELRTKLKALAKIAALGKRDNAGATSPAVPNETANRQDAEASATIIPTGP